MGYDNVFNNKNKKTQTGETWKFPNIGDFCAGVLVKAENFDSEYKGTATKQRRYTLIQDDGSALFVYGRYAKPGEYKAFPELDAAPLGSVVGVKYMGEKLPKTGGLAYKVFDVFVDEEIKLDVLKAFEGEQPEKVDALATPF